MRSLSADRWKVQVLPLTGRQQHAGGIIDMHALHDQNHFVDALVIGTRCQRIP